MICRTPDESFRAGWEDAAHDRPLSPSEITRLAVLLRPHLDLEEDAQAVPAAETERESA
jgi:hypothetical protein